MATAAKQLSEAKALLALPEAQKTLWLDPKRRKVLTTAYGTAYLNSAAEKPQTFKQKLEESFKTFATASNLRKLTTNRGKDKTLAHFLSHDEIFSITLDARYQRDTTPKVALFFLMNLPSRQSADFVEKTLDKIEKDLKSSPRNNAIFCSAIVAELYKSNPEAVTKKTLLRVSTVAFYDPLKTTKTQFTNWLNTMVSAIIKAFGGTPSCRVITGKFHKEILRKIDERRKQIQPVRNQPQDTRKQRPLEAKPAAPKAAVPSTSVTPETTKHPPATPPRSSTPIGKGGLTPTPVPISLADLCTTTTPAGAQSTPPKGAVASLTEENLRKFAELQPLSPILEDAFGASSLDWRPMLASDLDSEKKLEVSSIASSKKSGELNISSIASEPKLDVSSIEDKDEREEGNPLNITPLPSDDEDEKKLIDMSSARNPFAFLPSPGVNVSSIASKSPFNVTNLDNSTLTVSSFASPGGEEKANKEEALNISSLDGSGLSFR